MSFINIIKVKNKDKINKNNQVPYFIKKEVMKKLILSFIIGVFIADEELNVIVVGTSTYNLCIK